MANDSAIVLGRQVLSWLVLAQRPRRGEDRTGQDREPRDLRTSPCNPGEDRTGQDGELRGPPVTQDGTGQDRMGRKTT